MRGYAEELLVAVSHLYYTEGLTQEEVAYRMNVSRVAVTRILKRARDEGLVQISVKRPLPELYDLALRLERRYGLKAVRVAPTGASAEDTRQALGRAGAELLGHLLRPGCRIGAAWSQTVSAIIAYVRKGPKHVLCVNELAGTYLAPDIPYGVSWPLAEKLSAPLESIPMPVLVKSEEAKQIMLKEQSIRKALSNAAKVDIALVGLGSASANSSLARTGYITAAHLQEFKRKGAAGDILMRYYDAQGRYLHLSFENRTISLEWEQIARLPLVVAMAFGPSKLEAIRGALAGSIIQGLVTDQATAESLLERG